MSTPTSSSAEVHCARSGRFAGGWRGEALADRLRAAGLHLAASAAVAAVVAALVVLVWYPGLWLHAVGGLTLIFLVAAVDVVIGPLLTLCVFDRRKRSLRLDLAAIALLQLGALAYGLHATAVGRPAFAVFAVDRFEIVAAGAIERDELERAPVELRTPGWRGPRIVGARLPEKGAERDEVLFSALASGADLAHFARHWRPYAELRPVVLARSRPLADLETLNEPDAVRRAIAATGRSAAALAWLPVQARAEDLVAFVDRETAEVVGFARLSPWGR